MWYMPMHISELIARIIFLYLKIFVFLIKQACLLAIISKFGGGVDYSILWLSFAQQKSTPKIWATFAIIKNLSKLYNGPMGEKSPNLVTPAFLHGLERPLYFVNCRAVDTSAGTHSIKLVNKLVKMDHRTLIPTVL
jgi:hypothetical protein